MAAKKNGTRTANYGEMHKNLKLMKLEEIDLAIQQEVDRTEPRHDMLRRLVGRRNKITGRAAMDAVFALLTKKGKRDVSAALARNG